MHLRTTAAIAAGAALGLAATGAIWQRRGEARDAAAYPAPGAFADVGGFRLHYQDQGSGAPTVVLDSGLGTNVLSWDMVAPAVAGFTRVVRFDRPGMGWSDAAPTGLARTARVVAHELHALLRGANIPGPYVLVGWSLGGLHMRAFASLWPAEVAGLVLVDASHERQMEELPANLRRLMTLYNGVLRVSNALAELGSPRALAPLSQRLTQSQIVSSIKLSDETLAANAANERSRKAMRAVMAESGAFSATMAEVRELRATTSFPPVPVVVITREAGSAKEDAMLAVWQTLQADQAALSPRGRQITAEGSGHLIPFERPDVIVEAIRDVVAQARADA